MKLLDKLNKRYNKDAKTIKELVLLLNSDGNLTAKGLLNFTATFLEEIDESFQEMKGTKSSVK